jgi:DNA mismatch repair protein MLH1
LIDNESERIALLLQEKREMLSEYFSIDIDESGQLTSLPLIISHLSPVMNGLPNFLYLLGDKIDWTQEESCLGGIARALAQFYRIKETFSLEMPNGLSTESSHASSSSSSQSTCADPSSSLPFVGTPTLKWVIEHGLFPASRSFSPPKIFVNSGVVVEIACLENLYKIFERC